MLSEKRDPVKNSLHPRNKNRERYDLNKLTHVLPELKHHITLTKNGRTSIDFSNPIAVRLLNTAILKYYYDIEYWAFPEDNLCPPIPGRADYLHYIADLLGEYNDGEIPRGRKMRCLDIGTGASCIYPIIGIIEYNWNFLASDIDIKSIQSAKNIVDSNPSLKGKVDIRLQKNKDQIFRGLISKKERIDVTICNPPFHASKQDLLKGSMRKVKNLTGKAPSYPKFNFSGNTNELIFKGGEIGFIKNMIEESTAFGKSVFWFTTLVSKESKLKKLKSILKNLNPHDIRIIEMNTGNKTSRILAWTYLSPSEQTLWKNNNW